MSTDEELKVLLTADAAQLQAGMEQGAASVQQSVSQMQATVAEEAAAFNTAVQAKIDAMMRLNVAFAGNLASAEDVTEAESALDQAMAAGAISADAQAGYMEQLAAAQADATVATEANTVALKMNGQVGREVGIMIGELARGNYTRLEGSTITLANRTGFLSSALSFLVSPAGMATEALAAVAAAAYEGIQDMNALREAIIATGGASGASIDALKGMEAALEKNGSTARQARLAVTEVAASGLFLSTQMQDAANAASNFSEVTGVSMDKAVKAIAALSGDPAKALEAFNSHLHFLTPAEAEQVAHLQSMGQKAEATSTAVKLLSDGLQTYRSRLDAAGDGDNTYFQKLQSMFSGTWESAKQLFSVSSEPLQKQLDQVTTQLNIAAKSYQGLLTQNANGTINVNANAASSVEVSVVNDLLKQRQALMSQLGVEQAKQISASKQQADSEDAVNKALSGVTKPKAGGKDGTAGAEGLAADDKQLFHEMQLNRTMSLAQEKNYWEQKRSAAAEGTAEYRQAVQELLQIKNKEATASREESRKEVADAKHSAEERIRAEKEVEREKEHAAAKARQLSLEKLKDEHDANARSVASTREQYQLEYSEGQITAQKLLQLEQQLVAQKLAIDKAYFEAKQKLDAGEPIAMQKDDAGIVKAQQDALASMLRYEKEFHVNSEKQWNTYAKQIEGAMQGAINGMLFQHQTLRQGLGNIALVIGEDFIKNAVMKPVNNFIEGEATKTSAAVAGAMQRAIVEQTAAKASIVADAATGKSQITSAAATGAAKAYQAIVGIPIVGPILAPIAAGVAFAGIEAFGGKLSSAQGGWERVPVDGMMTQLHKDEMVLPKHVADPIRQMAQGGGNGGGTNINIHATDARSITELLRRDISQVAKLAKFAQRRGHL